VLTESDPRGLDMASSLALLDLSKVPLDVITVLLQHTDLQQRFTCARVCSDWAKAAAAATNSIVKHDLRDLTQLQQWLEQHGSHIEVLQLHDCQQVTLASLPCGNLQELLLKGVSSERDQALFLNSRVWRDIAAATKLTSVSLRQLCTESKQADVVSALTALPDLQQLTWWEVRFGHQGMLTNQWSGIRASQLYDSRLLPQLTQLTSLSLWMPTEEVLQHVTVLTKLQHLHILLPVTWPAADVTALQELTAITSLALDWLVDGLQLPHSVSHLSALQQLHLTKAKAPKLTPLAAFSLATALTKLQVGLLSWPARAPPLQLAMLQDLCLEGDLYHRPAGTTRAHLKLPTSYLAHCTQLRRLSLRCFDVTGPGSLVTSSLLQELDLQACSLNSDDDGLEAMYGPGAIPCPAAMSGPAAMTAWEVLFPVGPGRLPHLTALSLWSVLPRPQHADDMFERLAVCCCGLQELKLGLKDPLSIYGSDSEEDSAQDVEPLSDSSVEEESDQLPDMAGLPHLTKLHVRTADDELCSSLAQLTGLQELRVLEGWALSSAGLRHLAGLEQLTSLGFQRGPECRDECRNAGSILWEQLSDALEGCQCAIVNKVGTLRACQWW